MADNTANRETGAQRPVITRIDTRTDVEKRNSLTQVLSTDIQQVMEAAKVVVETAAGTVLGTKLLEHKNDPPKDK